MAGGDMVVSQGTLGELIKAARPYLKEPDSAALKYWESELGNLPLKRITPQLLISHADALRGAPTRGNQHKHKKPRSDATTRKYLIALSAAYKVGIKRLRICSHNPVNDVPKPDEGEERKRFLTQAERTALLEACRSSESVDLYLAVLMSLTTGMRRGELHALRWKDVDLPRRWAVLLDTKNGESRGVPLTVETVALLKDRQGEPDALVFQLDLQSAWKTALRRSGVKDFRWHDLRHSCGAMLVERGVGIRDIAKLLGHKRLQSAMRYTHTGDQHLQNVIDAAMDSEVNR